MGKNIVVGGFEMESNSLTAVKSTRQDFSLYWGEQMLPRIHITEYLRSQQCEIIPTLLASASPGGSIKKEDFESILADLLAKIPVSGVDGVWLLLHGAMDVEGFGSGDLAIVRAVREKVGPNVPIAAALDLHANIDPEFCKYVNVVCGFRTAPHIDIPRTQLHAAELLLDCLEKQYLPKPVAVKIPVIASGDAMTTDVAPGSDVIEKLWEMEKTGNSVCLNLFIGNPWVDSPYAGGAVVAVPNPGMEDEARAQALSLAEIFWKVRGDFSFRARTADVESGINWILEQTASPLFATDTGDNVSGGGSGDNALLIKTFMDKGIDNTLFLGIADAPVVAQCENLAPDTVFTCTLGGTLDPNSVSVTLNAKLLRKGVVCSWPGGMPIPSVLLESAGNQILVTAMRTPVVYKKTLDDFDLHPEKYRCTVVKLGYLWPELQEVAADSIMLFAPGSACEVVEQCVFHHIPRPIYPIDKDMDWMPTIA